MAGATHAYSQSLECLEHTVAYSQILQLRTSEVSINVQCMSLSLLGAHHTIHTWSVALLVMLVYSLHTTLSLPTFLLPLHPCTLQGGGEK